MEFIFEFERYKKIQFLVLIIKLIFDRFKFFFSVLLLHKSPLQLDLIKI
jgi:hypothetical protein